MQLNIPNNFISKFNVMVIAMQNLQFLKKEGKNKNNFKVSCLFYGAALQSRFDSFLQQKCKIQKSVLIYHYVPF